MERLEDIMARVLADLGAMVVEGKSPAFALGSDAPGEGKSALGEEKVSEPSEFQSDGLQALADDADAPPKPVVRSSSYGAPKERGTLCACLEGHGIVTAIARTSAIEQRKEVAAITGLIGRPTDG